MSEEVRLATQDREVLAAREIASWGRLLLALGAAMVAVGPLVSVQWTIWGVLVLGVGALSHKLRERPMFLACGIVLAWAGVSHLLTSEGTWGFAGLALAALGLAMVWRFRQFRRLGGGDSAHGLRRAVEETVPWAPSPLRRSFPFLSYGLGIAALLALPLVYVLGLPLAGGRAPVGKLLTDLLTADTALAALGLALGCAALPDDDKRRRPLAIWGSVGSSIVLLAFVILVIVSVLAERS